MNRTTAMKTAANVAHPLSLNRSLSGNDNEVQIMSSLVSFSQQAIASTTLMPQFANMDGVYICIRPVRADDRERFRQGFEALSDETRYCRCFNYRNNLTDTELDMLCNVDGTPQDVLVALSLDSEGNECESVGGARLVKTYPASATAEMAFLVTDAWQRRRVGLWLLSSMVDVAREQGIARLRCYLLPENFKARRLLTRVAQKTGSQLVIDDEGGLLQLDTPASDI